MKPWMVLVAAAFFLALLGANRVRPAEPALVTVAAPPVAVSTCENSPAEAEAARHFLAAVTADGTPVWQAIGVPAAAPVAPVLVCRVDGQLRVLAHYHGAAGDTPAGMASFCAEPDGLHPCDQATADLLRAVRKG